MLKCSTHVQGMGNTIIIENGAILKDCSIEIKGNNNTFIVKKGCHLFCANPYFEDNNGMITINEGTIIAGTTHLACIEGRRIEIGKECLFSSEIIVRVGDSHSVIDLNGNRINPSSDVIIGDHVWIGNRTIILKGTHIEDNCVVGSAAVVTGKKYKHNSAIAGNPAKIIKSSIDWDSARLHDIKKFER